MKKPEQTNERLSSNLFAAMRTELTAQKIISGPTDDQKRYWNAAMDRAISCLASYRNGDGLYQMFYKEPENANP